MNREQLVDFIEKIRPRMRDSGSPEEVLIEGAKQANLAPAQLESAAQLMNTAQQLHFMDVADNRGDSFRLVDVPGVLEEYTGHEMPKAASGDIAENNMEFTKAARVEQRDGKYVLLSKKGKVLGTHDSAEKAWKQEYAIQKSQEREAAKVAMEDPALDRPEFAERAPDVNAIMRRDMGEKAGHVPLPDMPPPLPTPARFRGRGKRATENFANNELAMIDQLEFEAMEDIRKVADDIAYRFRTEGDLHWGEIKEDAARRSEELAKAAATVEDYLGQVTGHLKVALHTGEVRPQPVFAEDRHGVLGDLEKAADSCDRVVQLRGYREHVKEAIVASPSVWNAQGESGILVPPGTPPPVEEEPEDRERGSGDEPSDEDLPAPHMRTLPEAMMSKIKKKEEEEEGKVPEGDGLAAKGVRGVGKYLDKVPTNVAEKALSGIGAFAPTDNEKQRKIDEAVTDTKTVTTLQRLMLTDPIIRDAEPTMVVSLFNTLQNANPELARDPNLLRFALREALQYESVPPHTYSDMANIEKTKTESRERQGKMEKERYNLSPKPKPKKEKD